MNNNYSQFASAIVLLIVAIGGVFGVAVEEDMATAIVGAVLVLLSVCVAIWKDHDFTSVSRTFGTLKRAYKNNETEIVNAIDTLMREYEIGKLAMSDMAVDGPDSDIEVEVVENAD